MPQALKLECSTNYGTIAPSSLDSRHWMYEKLKNIEARDRIIEIHCSSIIGTIVLRRPKSGDWMYEKFKNIEFSYSKWQFHCTGKHGTLSSSKWQVTSDHCTGKCGTLSFMVASDNLIVLETAEHWVPVNCKSHFTVVPRDEEHWRQRFYCAKSMPNLTGKSNAKSMLKLCYVWVNLVV